MPIDQPDASVHKICRRCRRWFDPSEGEMVLPEATGPISAIHSAAASIASDEPALRFICHACLRTRRRTKAIVWGAFAMAIGITFLVA
jgi:hypothetical protein